MSRFPFAARPLLLGAMLSALGACASQPPSAAPAATSSIAVPAIQRPQGETPSWWFRSGAAQAALASAQANAGGQRAKNVIVFLGDGMSIPTIAAAHVLAGERAGVDGESYRLSFEKFPFSALSRTYETDQQTPDSAGTMTAIMSGVKTRAGFIGVSQLPKRQDCAGSRGQQLVSALELAASAGMATGAVTTTRITHATPAATYGHLPERNWEVDADLSEAAKTAGCKDFAAQLIDFPVAGGLTVAMGGGRTEFMPAGADDPEYATSVGQRLDGRDLIGEWTSSHPDGKYVWNAAQLKALDLTKTPRLLGLFEPSHMNYEHERAHDKAGEPSLAEMTTSAIEVLKRNPNGFFLMVEGGRIDHALHAGNAYRALDETIAFADAVQAALEHTDPAETLIVVTADHSHTMTFAGYAHRGNPILGKVIGKTDSYGGGSMTVMARDATGQAYTTLGFANGPGYTGASDWQAEGSKRFPHNPGEYSPIRKGRPDLGDVDTTDPDYMQEATVPLKQETHGGEDVAIFATGPGAAAFHGELEQNVIFHVMVQHTPRLRAELCRLGSCNADGVPVEQSNWQHWLKLASDAAAAPR
ncbi:alkaline phosphatase [Rhodanobacter thiooxydans]|uniref:Alkaline phosphatase n=1 Tax=Rhodanobacter thiooxydans TaxID=416169 RepID=A0A154QME0_9GAMM|nr:alkaline phosphatase [Rhodanobacter thiooxydans]EIL97114.1 alkaline phosphatase [Rhodanobacter thiooxydans LCS2]KZC25271.1 alkaline phosphatase [Rhodanobacter thiooxydans]MCW0201099.1 alkaline phosphatase [Rhodanobacter thiooxydans]